MFENIGMLQRVNLYFWGFTDLLLSFCLDGINKKRKNAPLSAALLSFCSLCEISICTSFQTYLRRDFVTTLYLISFFAPKPMVYTSFFTHNQIFSFGRSQGTFGVLTPVTFGAKVSNSASSSVLSVAATAVAELLWACRVFLAQMEGRSFFKVLDIKQWSSLNFQASFSVDSSFGCPLRQFKGASSLPSDCISHFPTFPTACLSFNFSSLFIIPQNSIEGFQAKFKVQKMPNCVWVAKLFQVLSYQYKAISVPLIINRGHFFQTCPTSSTIWLHVPMIMKV